jgi:hypothetical protein
VCFTARAAPRRVISSCPATCPGATTSSHCRSPTCPPAASHPAALPIPPRRAGKCGRCTSASSSTGRTSNWPTGCCGRSGRSRSATRASRAAAHQTTCSHQVRLSSMCSSWTGAPPCCSSRAVRVSAACRKSPFVRRRAAQH